MGIMYAITKKEITKLSKYRPKGCPTKNLCVPISISIGNNGAGTCVGLIINYIDLDCIKYCKFIWKGKGEVERHQFCATPTEVMDMSLGLLDAINALFHYSKEYQVRYKHLEGLRKSGTFNEQLVGVNEQIKK